MRTISRSASSFSPNKLLIVLCCFVSACGRSQEVSYRLVGKLDPGGSLYVVTDGKLTATGAASVYTWIDDPAASGTIRVKTLDPKRTSVGYFSKNLVPVEGSAADGTVELILLPLEAARGVERKDGELRLGGARFLGLQLDRFDFNPRRIEFHISASPGCQLFETLPAFSCGKRGNPIDAIEHPGNFVLTDGTATYLLRLSSYSSSSVDLEAYKQLENAAPYLFKDPKSYEERIAILADEKGRK